MRIRFLAIFLVALVGLAGCNTWRAYGDEVELPVGSDEKVAIAICEDLMKDGFAKQLVDRFSLAENTRIGLLHGIVYPSGGPRKIVIRFYVRSTAKIEDPDKIVVFARGLVDRAIAARVSSAGTVPELGSAGTSGAAGSR
jgi:hypothetical protein